MSVVAIPVTPTKESRKIGKEKIENVHVNIVSPEPKKREAESETPKKILAQTREQQDVPNQVKQVYKVIHKATGVLGGNGYNGAIYGELTVGSMQKVIDFLVSECELSQASRFIDVGSGLGKPNFHALQSPEVSLSLGVELEEIRWILAMHNLNFYFNALSKDTALIPNHNINFICADIDAAHSLDPFTHVYMYDLGFPPDLQKSIANKFNQSVYPRYLISYRPPRRVIDEYGYEVEFIHQMNTKMYGK
jgi:hypothetical protein